MSGIPSLSKKEALILEMLINNPHALYALEMVRESKNRLKSGTVYVTLSRMEDKGYVQSHQETLPEGARGIPRRLYRPTGHGARVYTTLRTLVALATGEIS